jgi:hypothetical protein
MATFATCIMVGSLWAVAITGNPAFRQCLTELFEAVYRDVIRKFEHPELRQSAQWFQVSAVNASLDAAELAELFQFSAV